ncbi:hypothetical protein LZC95_07965 [Pendulispora brunnea]|uniref:RNA polymerase sigma factor 70 region 4 type 2 domain-containing protein n=1 Tax=Pendulispora brunnea TaxID=2905690 RepID=A0ABZ2KI83_9BACT
MAKLRHSYRPKGSVTADARALAARQRQTRVVELRIQGKTYDEIAKELGYASHTGAINAFASALAAVPAEDVAHLRHIEGDRLDAIVKAHLPKAMAGDVDSAYVCIEISKQRSRLFGLDTPKVAPVANPDGGPSASSSQDAILDRLARLAAVARATVVLE